MNLQVGAASTHVHDLLTGPPRPGTVRRIGGDRAVVEAAGRLVVLVRRPGPQTLPCAVVVPDLEPDRFDARTVSVGGGRMLFADRTVEIVRWWEPARVRQVAGAVAPPPLAPARVLDDDTHHALHEAAAALVSGDRSAAAEPLVSVLGRGRGSTPDADDAVAGLLLAARAVNTTTVAACLEGVAADVAVAARTRTTLLSAELLRAAASGYAAPVLVQHLASPTPVSQAAVHRLGATSGRATLEGVSALHHVWWAGRQAVAA